VTRRYEPLVVCYHAVSSGWRHALAVDPPVLERQVRALLLRRWRPARAGDVASGRGRLLHVTFDDAYTSVYAALPVLERLRVPATIFACSGFADGGKPLLVPELADEPAAELDTMDWDELRAVAERGVEIASHTVTHPHLPRLSDAEVERELRESRDRIADELRRPCRFLAYPYGEEQPRIRALAERAGYDAAFALPGSRAAPHPFALPRAGLYRADGRVRAWAKTSPFVDRVHAQRQPAT
jgi:peptidoglycan/xylan/chitin deacetylase (PgdA/CDA1 family)